MLYKPHTVRYHQSLTTMFTVTLHLTFPTHPKATRDKQIHIILI